MQVYALEEKSPISVDQAEKKRDYRCPLCTDLVRLRHGGRRKAHFYHIRPTRCRLAQKGAVHLELQYFVQSLFEKEAQLEKPFPEIGRIADVACVDSKKIYEIQCSPISLEEAKGRCADYTRAGFQVIWILHAGRYGKKKAGPAERFLRTTPCYYTDWEEGAGGMIYDLGEGGEKLPVDLRRGAAVPNYRWPKELQLRAETWPLYHKGDLFDRVLTGNWTSTPSEKRGPLLRLKELYKTALDLAVDRCSR